MYLGRLLSLLQGTGTEWQQTQDSTCVFICIIRNTDHSTVASLNLAVASDYSIIDLTPPFLLKLLISLTADSESNVVLKFLQKNLNLPREHNLKINAVEERESSII